jgi:tRNA 2-selenouridine synthase
MIKEIDIYSALDRDDLHYIDVRSPKEFEDDTIPGAVNLPILDDEEREYVGYLYKQVDPEQAKEKGLEYASKKLVYFYQKVKEMQNSNKKIALFCYRGGMRSNSIARVLDAMGIEIFIIKGGYKSYRKHVIDKLNILNTKHKYVVLHGYTGVGKTKILKLLEEKDYSILNLEEIAKNSGSVFGSVAYGGMSNSQKKFESLLVKELDKVNDKIIFTESESKRIGKAIIPDPLFNNMENGYHILISTNMENRIKNTLDDYINIDSKNKDENIRKSIYLLKKRLGNNKVEELIKEFNNNNYEYIICELMVNYYDPLYKYSIDKLDQYDKIIEYNEINEAVDQLINFLDGCSK